MVTRLRNLSVGAKVFAIVGLCLASLIGVSTLSIFQMDKIGDEIEAIAEQDIPLTEILTKITVHQLEQAIKVLVERVLHLIVVHPLNGEGAAGGRLKLDLSMLEIDDHRGLLRGGEGDSEVSDQAELHR